MKVSPVRSTAPAPIPTAAEAAADPTLVAPAPTVRPRRGSGVLLGAGLLGSLVAPVAGCARGESSAPAETPTAAIPTTPAEADAAARAEAERAALATTVAPILQKAMDEEGRGSFGCMAIDPPVVLSETEALNLIEQEFAKAGVKLRDAYELTGYTRTVDDPRELARLLFNGEKNAPAPKRKTEPGSWVFDLATEDGSLLLEYLSLADHDKIAGGNMGDFSTVSSYDLPRQAEHFRADLATRKDGAPVTVGLFIDPLMSEYLWDEHGQHPRPIPGLAELSKEKHKPLTWEKRDEILRKTSLDLLREQVRFFLDWARKEGKLPTRSAAEELHAEGAESAE